MVACGTRATGLPVRHDGAVGGARYRFTSTTTTYAPAGLARVARDLRRRAGGAPDALVGVFPGSPHALTVLTGREAGHGWAWSSWHVYPGGRRGRAHPLPAEPAVRRPGLVVVALVLVVAGIAGIVSLTQRGSVRSHVLRTYDVVSQDGDSYVLRSPDTVTRDRCRHPRRLEARARRSSTPGGTFLRYSDDIVAVTPRAEGGSTVYLDDEDRGYNRWFPYVVGFWGVGGGGGPDRRHARWRSGGGEVRRALAAAGPARPAAARGAGRRGQPRARPRGRR